MAVKSQANAVQTLMETALTAQEPIEVALVEVALPVPLHRDFVYSVPERLQGRLSPGMRVAVPFAGRTLAGFVLGPATSVPSRVRKLRSVLGCLEDEAVFDAELWSFLRAAAQYYMHPLGEVLRAAAPSLPAQAIAQLRRQGWLSEEQQLPGAAVEPRKLWWARRLAVDTVGLRLGERQRRLLELLAQASECSVEDLRLQVPEARTVLRGLADKGLVALEQRLVTDAFFRSPSPADSRPSPNPAQQHALEALRLAIEQRRYAGFLLHGVTGSGKTEVYLQAIASTLTENRSALVLVPEIALTPQLVSRFRARFGDAIAVLHSGLSPRDRDSAWQRLRGGQVRLAVGARSALFAPLRDLGIIVVDEEHDPSFKQEDGFRYQARDMALLRAERAAAVCILGSATPSMESYHLVEQGKLRLLHLPERATSQSLPSVEIIDLARHRQTPSGHPLLSAPLHKALERCLQENGQAILFLNRRGFSPSLRCVECGEMAQCPACSVTLTEHRRTAVLRCHYCDFSAPLTMRCSACGADALERLGVGTERLEQLLSEVFAPARVARLDRDAVRGDGVEAVLDAFRERRIDILVGTQMVTKGHDMPGVTLVGIILADQSLAFPDFRAGERTFQLLSQVAGRAGRGVQAGKVILQTFQPTHPAVQFAQQHDYLGFCRAELQDRRELGYPPYARLVAVRVDATDEGVARRTIDALAEVVRVQLKTISLRAVQLLGPAPAPVARIRGRYRFRMLLRSAEVRALRSVAHAVVQRIEAGVAPARASVDIDPVSML